MAENRMVNKVLAHWESLKAERKPWADTVTEVLKLVIPGRANMQVNTDPRTYTVDRESRDGTAKSSAYFMATGLLGNVCSQRSAWFKTIPELPIHEDITGLREWLDTVDRVFYHIFNTGNFYASAWQGFLDSATAGLASIIMLEDLNEMTVNFTTYAPRGAYIETNASNVVDTFFHHFTLTARDILEEYPDAELPESFKTDAENNPFKRFEIINAIFPRKDRDIYKIDSVNKPFASVHILLGEGNLLRESGFDSFPLSVFRYEFDSEEVYPHSPSIDGYADIQRSNEISKATTDVAQLISNPTVAVPSEIFNEYKIQPNFKLKVIDMERLPVPLQVGQGYPIGRDREELYKRMVEEHYFKPFFIMLAQADGVTMTATEVLERQGEKATVIGGLVSRLTKEFLDPIFARLFVIAARNKWIPEPPPELLIRNIPLSIDYIGPLAQAQQRYLKTQGPVASLQTFLPLLEAFPNMALIIKEYELAKHVLDGGGMPSAIVRTEDEYNAILQPILEAQAQAQQAETMKAEAEALNKGSKAPEPGSPTEAVANAG